MDLMRWICLLAASLSCYRIAQKASGRETLAILTALCMAALTWNLEPRPYLFSPLFFLVLYDFFRRKIPEKMHYILIPLIMALWANIHGEFAIASLILLLTAFMNEFGRYRRMDVFHSRSWTVLAVIAVGCALINPHPIALLERILFAGSYPSLDWKPFIWWIENSPAQIVPPLFILLADIGILYHSIRQDKQNASHFFSARFLLEILSVLFALRYIRLAWLLIFPILGFSQTVARNEHLNDWFPPENRFSIFPIAFLTLALFLCEHTSDKDGVQRMPKEGVQYFMNHIGSGNIYTRWQWSGYVTFNTQTKAQIFVDTRIEPFDENDIDLVKYGWQEPEKNIQRIANKNTQYILLPIDKYFKEWKQLEKNNRIKILFQNQDLFLAEITQ